MKPKQLKRVWRWVFLGAICPLWASAGTLVGTAVVNPLDASGSRLQENRLVLVVVDTLGDGFAAATDHGIEAGPIGNFLGSADDRIMGINGSVPGLFQGDVLAPGTASFPDGQYTGKAFGLVFFTGVSAQSADLPASSEYGFVHGANWILPDSGSPTFGGGGFEVVTNAKASLTLRSGASSSISYADWAASHFEDPRAPEALPLGNEDGDDYDNLFEFAFGMNPRVASGVGAPIITLGSDSSGEFLVMDYRRPLDREGLEIRVEVSKDMQQWSSGPGVVEAVSSETADGWEHLEVRSVASSTTCLFMRVRVMQLLSSG